MKKNWILLLLLIFFYSCSDVGKILRNEKMGSTDEFLVKKKGPLVFPPNYEVVPSPDSISNKDEQKNKIQKILKTSERNKKISNNSSTVEKSILEKIR
jgi:hypothetical protein